MCVVADLYLQHLASHAVGLVVPVVEVEIQVTEFACLGLWVVLREVGAFEYQRLDAVLLHGVDDVLLYLLLVAVPPTCLLKFGQPWNLHLTWYVEICHGVGCQGSHMVLLHQSEEAPPVFGRQRDIKTSRLRDFGIFKRTAKQSKGYVNFVNH